MPNALFRTNHAYDPVIQKNSATKVISKKSDTMIRYMILKDAFNYYADKNVKIGDE